MKKFKQTLSLLLAAFMLVGITPAELVNAEEVTTQVTEESADEAVESVDEAVADDSNIITVPGVGEVQLLSEEETEKYVIGAEDDNETVVDELPTIVVESGAAVLNGYPVSDDNTIYGIPVDEIDWDDPETYKVLNNRAIEAGDVPSLGATPKDFDDIEHGDRKSSGVKIRQGIDVSSHNGDIDWEKVKKDGIYFAFIRVGYRGTGSAGSLNTDKKWKENFKGAKEAGVKIGAYFFSQAITLSEAREEADEALSIIGSYKNSMTLPLAMDYEYYDKSSRLYKASLSDAKRTEIVNAFCARVEAKSSLTPIVYASYSLLVDDMNADDIDYDVWLARYNTKTGYDGDYTYWQFTSKGSVDGIKDDVDLDVWYDGGSNITFNANGGTCSKTSKGITKGKEIGTLPIPTRKGYVFNGWMRTKNDIDTLITEDSVPGEDGVPTKGFTVYAMWLEQQITTVIDVFDSSNKKILETDGVVMDIESGGSIRALYIDKSRISNQSYTFYVNRTETHVTLKDEDRKKMTGECQDISDISDLTFGWSSNNSSVATISGTSGNYTKVTIVRGATGAGNIQGRYNNPKKSGSDVEIYIVDYTPVLAATKATLNKSKDIPGTLKAFSAYGNTIKNVTVKDSDKFTSTYNAETQNIEFSMDSKVSEGTYTVKLLLDTLKGYYEKTVTLTVENKVLTDKDCTIKQSNKFDLFFSSSAVLLTGVGKSARVDRIVSKGNSTFTVEDFGDGTAAVFYKNEENPSFGYVSGKPDTTLVFDIYYHGYTNPVKKTITLNTENSVVKGSLSRKATVFSGYGEAETSAAMSVNFTGRVASKGAVEVYVSTADSKYVDIEGTGESFTLIPKVSSGLFYNGKNSATITIYARDLSWAAPVAIKHKITYNTKLPTVKFGKSNGAIYTALGNSVATPIVANVNDLSGLTYDVEYPTGKLEEEGSKIAIEYDDNYIYAKVATGSSMPAKGSYKFGIIPKLPNGTALKKINLTVKVIPGAPAIKFAKSQVSLNTTISDIQSLMITSMPDGVEIVGIEAHDTGKGTIVAAGNLNFDYHDKQIDVSANEFDIKGSYKVDLYPVVYCEESGVTTQLAKTSVTVKLTNADPVLAVTGKGRYNLIDRYDGMLYTIKGGKNVVIDPASITSLSLDGENSDDFTIMYWYYDSSKKCVFAYVCVEEDAVLSTTETYKIALTAEINDEFEVSTSSLNIKPVQPEVKATVSGDTTINQEAKGAREDLEIRITSPDGHPISRVEVNENSLPGALAKGTNLDSLTDADVTYNRDGSATIHYTLTRTSYLIKGESYTFKIFVVPEGAAVNKVKEDGEYVEKTVGTTIECTIKVIKPATK